MKSTKILSLTAMLALVALMTSAGAGIAREKTYHFGISDQRTNISFESVTDFETVLGSSHKIMGQVMTDLKKNAMVDLTIPVSSLRTGIDMRDEHLRSPMWLDAETYPNIHFVSTRAKKQYGSKWSVRGDFTMHGVTRNIETTVNVRQIPIKLAKKAGLEAGEWVKVTTEFEVKLSDYGVMIPKMAAAKVNDTWKVTYTAYASTKGGGMAMNPCNPCGKMAMNPCGKMAKNPCNPCG